MKYYVAVLALCSCFFGFSQEKIDSELFIYSNWGLYSYSSGEPFISSDTVILYYCGDAYIRARKECWEQGDFEWEVFFDEPFDEDEIQENLLFISKGANRGKMPQFMFDDVLYWKLKGKSLVIMSKGTTVKYKVDKMKDNLLVFTLVPEKN